MFVHPTSKCVWVCDNVYMVESVGVDSSVLIYGLGYTADIVDNCIWHCTSIKYQFVRWNPTDMSIPKSALCKIVFDFSVSIQPIFLLVCPVIRASSCCEGKAANWNAFMHKKTLLNVTLKSSQSLSHLAPKIKRHIHALFPLGNRPHHCALFYSFP